MCVCVCMCVCTVHDVRRFVLSNWSSGRVVMCDSKNKCVYSAVACMVCVCVCVCVHMHLLGTLSRSVMVCSDCSK